MAKGVSLDELRQQSRQRYADYPVTLDDGSCVVLRAPMRLSKEERTKVRQMQHRVGEIQEQGDYDEDTLIGLLGEIIQTVSDDAVRAKSLIGAIGDDLSVMETMLDAYSERTQAGEALHSAS